MELTQSVYRLRTLKQMGRYTSLGAKMTAILLPVLQVALLKTKAVQSSTSVFLFLTNFISERSTFREHIISQANTISCHKRYLRLPAPAPHTV